MPFCAAAAVVDGEVRVDTFDSVRLADPSVASVMARVTMTVDRSLGVDRPALTQARVRVRLRDGRTLTEAADGARGYPDQPASDAELSQKFLSCAARAVPGESARHALTLLQNLEAVADLRTITSACTIPDPTFS
jgi:2-methylcitrate dehydratase PrpD